MESLLYLGILVVIGSDAFAFVRTYLVFSISPYRVPVPDFFISLYFGIGQ